MSWLSIDDRPCHHRKPYERHDPNEKPCGLCRAVICLIQSAETICRPCHTPPSSTSWPSLAKSRGRRCKLPDVPGSPFGKRAHSQSCIPRGSNNASLANCSSGCSATFLSTRPSSQTPPPL